MRITLKRSKKQFEVFGVYLVDGNRYFCFSPDNYDGLIVVSEKDVDAVSGEPPTHFIKIEGGLYHPAVRNAQRLERLLEHDHASYEKFKLALGSGSGHA